MNNKVSTEEQIKISCRNVWKIFGRNPQNALESVSTTGTDKEKFLEETGHVIAIKDVSFEVKETEIFVIMGLSGSGKSTLVRCINRLIEPTDGSILVDGNDISRMDANELNELRRHKLSMVFQNFGLLSHRSVLGNVLLGLEIRGEDKNSSRETAMEALELVGLKSWSNSRIDELSGGMQQRVGLARALATGPEILLMDEPFSALDPLIRRQMQEEFLNLSNVVKKTVLFITHDLTEALKLGDRIAIMKDGELVQLGSPEEIVSRPANDYVREFVKDVPREKVVRVRNIIEKSVYPAGITTAETGKLPWDSLPFVSPNATLETCLQVIAESDVPLAVIDEERQFLGAVTKTMLIKAILSDNCETGEYSYS